MSSLPAATASTGNCTFNWASARISSSGNSATVSLPLSPTPGLTNPWHSLTKNAFGWASTAGDSYEPWECLGQWQIP